MFLLYFFLVSIASADLHFSGPVTVRNGFNPTNKFYDVLVHEQEHPEFKGEMQTRIWLKTTDLSEVHEFIVNHVETTELCNVIFTASNDAGDAIELTYRRRGSAGRHDRGARRHHQLAGKVILREDENGNPATLFLSGEVLLSGSTRLPSCAYTYWPENGYPE